MKCLYETAYLLLKVVTLFAMTLLFCIAAFVVVIGALKLMLIVMPPQ